MISSQPTPGPDPSVGRSESSDLIRRLLADELSPAEFAAVEDRLRSDAYLRQEYVQYVDTEAALEQELSRLPTIPVEQFVEHLAESRNRHSFKRWMTAAGVGAAAALLVAFLANLAMIRQAGSPPLVADAAVVAPATKAAGVKDTAAVGSDSPASQRAQHITAPLQGLPDVAVVTAFDDEQPSIWSIGTRLKPGVLVIRDGEMQLDFVYGTRLVLQGPAELHLVSATAATLVSGTAVVRVPSPQSSFVLSTLDAAVVGTETEFGVKVQRDGSAQVEVFTGSAEISLLGDDGTTLFSNHLDGSLAVEVNAATRRFALLPEPLSGWPKVRELDQAQLVVTDDYVTEIERSRPYLYWRFDEVVDGRIPDGLNGPHSGVIVGDEEGQDAIRIANGVAEFLPCSTPRSIASLQPIADFNANDFTIELWVMPSEMRASSIFSAVLPDESQGALHLSLIEVAHNTNLVHRPGVIRFLHRQPPSKAGGYNLFSQEVCTPGVWTHVVATKSLSELRLYINGQLIRNVSGPGTGASDDLEYRVILGQLGTGATERQFHGLIDEVALYRRVLRPDEISRHYWSIRRGANIAALEETAPATRLTAMSAERDWLDNSGGRE